jgi:putative membrane protein insertion efficiency factor
MIERLRMWLWMAGAPVRLAELFVIRIYRLTLSGIFGGRCRFHPSCSQYAEQAVRELGALRGSVLSVWRVLRCSPLSAGGVDYPPARQVYDSAIHLSDRHAGAPHREGAGA